MYAKAAVKPNPLLRNGAYGIVMRGVQKCTRGCSSLRGRKRLPLCCIKLDTATDPAVGSGAFPLGMLNEIVRARQNIFAYNVTVFKTAAVYPVVFRIKMVDEKRPVTMDVMDSMTTVANHNVIDSDKFYADISWDKYFNSSAGSLEIVEKMSKFKPLKYIADVNGAATVSEAYLVKEFLQDNSNPDFEYKKFINTGGLDPYKSFFGIEDMRYLKGKYLYPVVSVDDLRNMSEKRLKESSCEKIIIGGMTKILECFYDKGEYLAGKSTTIVYGYEHLKYITALLNSRLMTFYYSTFYNSMSLAGGFFRIGAPQIKELPIAMPDDENVIHEIEQYVDEILSIMDCKGSVNDNSRLQELYDLIDQKVYQLYGLSNDEIQCVKEGR